MVRWPVPRSDEALRAGWCMNAHSNKLCIRVLNKRTDDIPADAFYVGRPSLLGNPFRIGVHGTREEVISKYQAWIEQELEKSAATRAFLAHIHQTAKNRPVALVCWCAPLPCHANVLKNLIENLP